MSDLDKAIASVMDFAHNGEILGVVRMTTEASTELSPMNQPASFQVLVHMIDGVRQHPDGDNLTIVSVAGNEIVANKHDDGSFRWAAGELAVYVPEGAIVPEDVLRERGYWDESKGKGLLGGGKGNRVKMIRFRGVESRGLIFKVRRTGVGAATSDDGKFTHEWDEIVRGQRSLKVAPGEDVREFFDITEYVG